MPKKTRKEKILTEKRRKEHISMVSSVPMYSLDLKSAQNSSSASPSIQSVNIMTGHADLKKDLAKITVFTVIAVVLQLILFFFVIK